MLLDPFTTSQIKSLLEESNSIRRVCKLTGVSRNTVRRIHRETPRKRRFGEAWQAMDAHRADVRQLFLECETNCSVMMRHLEPIIGPKLPSLRTLQEYCMDFRQEVRQAGRKQTVRVETSPGLQMQIDFGVKWMKVGDEVVKVHVFVAILGYSRRIFAKVYDSETQEDWLDGIRSAYQYFGGVTRDIVCDNAKALVKNRNAPVEERYADAFRWLCESLGVTPMATSIAMPNSKGKVEAAVRYVKHNALVHVHVATLDELNAYLEDWCRNVADVRVMDDPALKGAKTPVARWELERKAMRPVSKALLESKRRLNRKVDKNGLVRVDYAMYRVPDQFAERNVLVVVCGNTLTVSYGGRTITLDKAKDIISAKNGDWSKRPDKEEKFEQKIKELEQDEEWQRMQNPLCQRDPSAYDAVFSQQGPAVNDAPLGQAEQGG